MFVWILSQGEKEINYILKDRADIKRMTKWNE